MAELKRLVKKRGSTKSKLAIFENYLNKLSANPDTMDVVQLKGRLENYNLILNEFDEIQSEIENLSEDSEAEFTNRESFENDFYNIQSLAISLVNKLSSDENRTTSGSEITPKLENQTFNNVKLPTIKLPVFDGSLSDWRGFLDAFNTLIHYNSNLANIQKLTYLKSALKDEPHRLISTLESTDLNYDVAINLLMKRYDNKRRIINNHVQAILSIRTITRESASQLKELINTVQVHINCLGSLGQPVDSWDAILIPILVNKLDNQTAKEWETKINTTMNNDSVPQLNIFLDFLNSSLLTLETLMQRRNDSVPNKSSRSFAAITNYNNNPICSNCSKDHFIYNCEQFLNLDDQSRNNLARKKQLCLNCLRKGHIINNCLSHFRCRICNKKHNTLLHINNQNINNNTTEKENSPQQHYQATSSSDSSSFSLVSTNSQTLLSTALVEAQNGAQHQNVRVLLDSASQSNFITHESCKKLNLQLIPINMKVMGITEGAINISHSTKLTLKSRVNNFSVDINCLVVPKIASAIPASSFDIHSVQIPVNIKLADPKFNESSSVDILIGAKHFWSITCVGQIQKENLILQKTKFGWILSGEILNCFSNTTVTCLSFKQLNKNVEKFWQIDEFISNTKTLTPDEQLCENYFLETTSRDESGRFIVKIPFKDDPKTLDNCYEIAKSRFYSLEKRFQNNKQLKAEYSNFINEYIDLNHMKKNITKNNKDGFYLPHHCVLKEQSETTKLRVVFDGSCNGSNNISLNDLQHKGPALQDDIFSILSRFRLYRYVLTADIEKMYRQIWVHPDHRPYQRILWRENENDELSVWELGTVTYGTKSAPYLAIRCLLELANNNRDIFPIESRIINEDFYVDDMITGHDNLEQLESIKANIIKILKGGGFELRKFHSNIAKLTISDASDSLNMLDKEYKTLGVVWHPLRDSFSYSLNINLNQSHVTKRTILALTAQLYDPLGLLAPVIVIAKLIIQDLWQMKLSWDETVPMTLHTKWIQFRDNIYKVNEISVPRQVLINDYTKVEMHIFSDASERAYGACIYLKSFNQLGQSQVALLAAKSRVAPLKKTTLPRLELCAATLAAQLADKFKTILKIHIDKEFYWCDSQIALSWISSNSNRWKTYVSNRVAEIQKLTDKNNWHYVKSHDNSADLVTRGVDPESLIKNVLWWQGPHWLANDKFNVEFTVNIKQEDLPEARKNVIQSFQVTSSNQGFPFEKFSKFVRLQRVTAYCIRFYKNLKVCKNKRTFGALTVSETTEATIRLIKIVQGESFTKELKNLSQKRAIGNKSKIITLTPFLDKHKIIRVGGRLGNSEFEYDKKHPIILPKHNHFSELIAKHFHDALMHAGPKLLLSSVREQYWPISGMNLAKKVVKCCVKCSRITANSISPIMGNLPLERTKIMYPFHSTGVDYAGPYSVKDRAGRGNKTSKCYICLFICFSTKAIHLELVSTLNTDSFLLALKRFIARRGKPLNIYSDNAKNFVGAGNELSNIGEFLSTNANSIHDFATNLSIRWHFIPPRSPTFGGLWEAGVKSVKYHLKRILLNVVLTFEEYNTLLTQIESILNSRPLTPLTSDPNDIEPLTPAHFLIGRTFTAIPDPDMRDVPTTRLTRYQFLQKLNMQFWSKWSKDYISQLQNKLKHRQEIPNIKVGTMVILREDNLPPAQWKLGRVIQLHPGNDNVTRVVTVQCAKGQFKRAVNRLCILPV